MSWLKKTVRKIGKSLKDATYGKSKFGFAGKSYLNPYTHGAWVAKQWLHGIRKGKAMANVSRYLNRSSSSGNSGTFRISGSSAPGYTYSGRSVSQLMGGR